MELQPGQDVVDQTDADFRNKNQAMETILVWPIGFIYSSCLFLSLSGLYCLFLPDHFQMPPSSPPYCEHWAVMSPWRENILVNLGKLESLK